MVKVHGIAATLGCMAASIVVYSEYSLEAQQRQISREYLKQAILDKYNGKYDAAITSAEHYIVRPVQFIADPRFSAGCGGGIVILNFSAESEIVKQSQQKILELLQKYRSVIISKFINTKVIRGKFFNLRTTVFASITKLDGNPHYNLRSYLCHFMDIMSSDTKLSEGQSQSEITSYNDMNTHSLDAEFKIYPMDLLKLSEITDPEVADYKGQMVEIITKVMHIFKSTCQIYPETENGFMELGFDFMIGQNDKVYLAEINTDLGYFDFRDSKRFLTSQYSLYNGNIMNAVIRGIIEPVLSTKKYIINLPEYDGFTEMVITENLDGDRSLPIKDLKLAHSNTRRLTSRTSRTSVGSRANSNKSWRRATTSNA